jgi:hypothetical protein
MKRIILLIACIGIGANTLKAQNPCTVSAFTTQASVTNFATDHPGCTQITGDVTISSGSVNSLAGLAAVTSISGKLDIDGTQLTSLTGLGALTTLGGSLRIANNSILTGVAALSKITSVGGFVSIGNNNALQSLGGLDGVATIAGQVSIASNGSLKNLSGLVGLTKINGYLNIADNPQLTSLTGLNQLTALGLTNTVAFYVRIFNNDALASLSGLDNINANSINNLIIQNSSTLSVCGVKSICKYLSLSFPAFTISDNIAGCNTSAQILATGACQAALPVDLVSFTGKSTSEGNVLNWITASEVNNAGFAIERSSNSRIFEQIGYVEGNGTIFAANTYSFTDTDPATITYYRLRQIDTDAKFNYSSIIAVKGTAEAAAVAIYPNPSVGQLFIKAKDSNQSFKIQTSNGVTIQEASTIPSKPIDTASLKNGLYLVTVGEEVFKVMVAN